MRSLICLLLIFPFVSFGESIRLATSYNNTNRNTTLSHDYSAEVSTLSTTLEYASKRFGPFQNYFNLRADQVDYSDYIIIDQFAAESRLSDIVDHDLEYYVDNTFEYSKYGLTVGISLFGHVSESPFKTRGAALRITQDFYNKTSTIGGELTLSRTDMPINFSATDQRPTHIDLDYTKIFYQQVLGPSSKVRLNLITGRRKQDRPRNYGVIGEYGHAISDALYSQLKLAYIKESQRSELLDERGYFSLASAQLLLTYEPVYDLLLSASYSLCRETEDDPRTHNRNQVGVDTYGMGIRYLLNEFEVEVMGALGRSNTLAKDYSLAGGIKWLL